MVDHQLVTMSDFLQAEEWTESEYEDMTQRSSQTQFQENDESDDEDDVDCNNDDSDYVYESSQAFSSASSSSGFSNVRFEVEFLTTIQQSLLQKHDIGGEQEMFWGENIIRQPKIITFLPLLLSLFDICRVPNCGSSCDPENKHWSFSGAMITIKATCNNNHEMTWSSSPMIGSGKSQVPAINLLIGAYAYICGVNFKKVSTH